MASDDEPTKEELWNRIRRLEQHAFPDRRSVLKGTAAAATGAALGFGSGQATAQSNNQAGTVGTQSSPVDIYGEDLYDPNGNTRAVADIVSGGISNGRVGWEFEKHPNNPVIPGTSAMADQFYPPSAIRDPSDDMFYVMGKSNNNEIYGFESSDGVSWSNETFILNSQSELGNDDLDAPFFVKDTTSGTYHLYFSSGDDFSVYDVYHFTASSPLGPYSADTNNPIFTRSELNTAVSRPVNFVYVSDVIILDGQFFWYGTAGADDPSAGYIKNSSPFIYVATGSGFDDINAQQVLFDSVDFFRGGSSLQGFSVLDVGDYLFAQVTASNTRADANTEERQIYSAVGGPLNFDPHQAVMQEKGDPGTWSEDRNYLGRWLKKQDPDANGNRFVKPELVNGKARNYYSGYDVDGNSGQAGLAEYEWPVRDIAGMAREQSPSITQTFRYSSTNDSFSNQLFTNIAFDSGDIEGVVYWDGGNSRFEVFKPGTYSIDASVRWDFADGSDIYIAITQNGTITALGTATAQATSGEVASISKSVDCSPGDTLAIQARQDSGVSQTIIGDAEDTYCTLTYEGP